MSGKESFSILPWWIVILRDLQFVELCSEVATTFSRYLSCYRRHRTHKLDNVDQQNGNVWYGPEDLRGKTCKRTKFGHPIKQAMDAAIERGPLWLWNVEQRRLSIHGVSITKSRKRKFHVCMEWVEASKLVLMLCLTILPASAFSRSDLYDSFNHAKQIYKQRTPVGAQNLSQSPVQLLLLLI